MFSAGFRPFFLLAGLWSAIAVPVWLCAYAAEVVLPSALPSMFILLYRVPLTQIKLIPD